MRRKYLSFVYFEHVGDIGYINILYCSSKIRSPYSIFGMSSPSEVANTTNYVQKLTASAAERRWLLTKKCFSLSNYNITRSTYSGCVLTDRP